MPRNIINRYEEKRETVLILGNPLVGSPIAALHINAPPITKRFGCGSSIPMPTLYTSGKMMSAATVCEMNVATTRIKEAKTTIMA